MPYATDRKDKMFTAYNLNTLYSRFDAKCRAALNEMGPLWAQSRFHPYDQWAAPFPYGVWYVYRNDPETALRLKDNGAVPDPSIPGIGYYRDEHNQVAARIELSKLENKHLDEAGGQVYVDHHSTVGDPFTCKVEKIHYSFELLRREVAGIQYDVHLGWDPQAGSGLTSYVRGSLGPSDPTLPPGRIHKHKLAVAEIAIEGLTVFRILNTYQRYDCWRVHNCGTTTVQVLLQLPDGNADREFVGPGQVRAFRRRKDGTWATRWPNGGLCYHFFPYFPGDVPYFAEGPPSWQIPNTSPFLALERSAQANNVANPFIMFDWLHTMGAQIDPTVQHDIRQVYPQTYADPGDFRQQLGDLVFTWGRAQVRYTIDPDAINPTYEDSEVNFPGVGSLVQRLQDIGITVVQNPTSITLTSRRGYFQITPIDCNIFNNGESPVWEISTTPITISTVYPPSSGTSSFWSAGNEATIFDKVIDVRLRLAVEAGFLSVYTDATDITEDRVGLLRLTPQGLACSVGSPIGIDGNLLIDFEAYATSTQLYVKSRNAGYGVGAWTNFYFESKTDTVLIAPSRNSGATSPGIPWQNMFPTKIGDSIPTSSTIFQGAINAAYIPPGGPWGFASGNYDNELMRATYGDPDYQSNGGYEADFWVNKWGGPNGVDASVRILGSPNKTPKFAVKPDGPNSSFVTVVKVAVDDVFRDRRNARFASTLPLSMASPVNANADYLTSIKFDWESNTYIFAIPYVARNLLNGGPGCGPFFHKIPKSAWLWNLLQWRLDSWTESICLCTQNFAPGLPTFFGTGYEPDFDLDAWYLDQAGYDLLSGYGVQCFRGEDSFSTEYFFVPPQNLQTWCRKFGFTSGNWQTEDGQPTEFPAVVATRVKDYRSYSQRETQKVISYFDATANAQEYMTLSFVDLKGI
jgi:hypothetical protein